MFRQAKRNKKIGLLAAVLVLVGVGGLLWKQAQPVPTAPEAIPLVRTAVVGVDENGGQHTYSGEVRGRYESPLAFRVGGKITQRYVQAGSAVKAGDLLLELDPKDLQQVANSAAAQVAAAESQLKLAESNLARYRQLYAQGAVSQAVLDQYQNAYAVAEAAARQAGAQYVQGANQLDYSSLYADKAGVVSAVNVEAGQVVSAGQTVLTLVQEGEREIEISVPENRLADLQKAERLEAAFWALPGVLAEGRVREVAPMADPATRTYKVRISLVKAPAEIKLGMTASVKVAGTAPATALYVPLSALYQVGERANVWVVEAGIAALRPVQVGAFGDGKIRILSGLQAGETVVTAGVHKLHDGQRVRLMGGDAL